MGTTDRFNVAPRAWDLISCMLVFPVRCSLITDVRGGAKRVYKRAGTKAKGGKKHNEGRDLQTFCGGGSRRSGASHIFWSFSFLFIDFHPPISEDSKQKNIKFHRKSIFPIYLQRFSSIHLLRRRNVLPIHQITVLRLIICPISIQRGFNFYPYFVFSQFFFKIID